MIFLFEISFELLETVTGCAENVGY